MREIRPDTDNALEPLGRVATEDGTTIRSCGPILNQRLCYFLLNPNMNPKLINTDCKPPQSYDITTRHYSMSVTKYDITTPLAPKGTTYAKALPPKTGWVNLGAVFKSVRHAAHSLRQEDVPLPIVVASCPPWLGRPTSRIVIC